MAYNDRGNMPPPREKNILDNPKLKLAAPSPGAAGKWASLQFLFFGNQARLQVYSNNPNDANMKHGGAITLKLPPLAFGNVFQLLAKAIDPATEKGWKAGYKCLETRWKDNKPSDEPMLEATVWVGKDEKGVVWISVIHWNKEVPRIKFEFGNTIFNVLIKADGEPMEDEEASRMWTMSILDILKPLLIQQAHDSYKHPEKKQDGGGYGGGNRGGQGGGQGGGNNNGGRSSAPANSSYEEVDLDIPF